MPRSREGLRKVRPLAVAVATAAALVLAGPGTASAYSCDQQPGANPGVPETAELKITNVRLGQLEQNFAVNYSVHSAPVRYPANATLNQPVTVYQEYSARDFQPWQISQAVGFPVGMVATLRATATRQPPDDGRRWVLSAGIQMRTVDFDVHLLCGGRDVGWQYSGFAKRAEQVITRFGPLSN